jgi:hypothetical protein
MLLNQLPMTLMLQMLTQNPNTAIFSFSTYDFPLGVTRAALLAAFIAASGNSGNFDVVTGSFNAQAYLPGANFDAESKALVTPACSQSVSSSLTGAAPATAPTVAQVGATMKYVVGPVAVVVSGAQLMAADEAMINQPGAVI